MGKYLIGKPMRVFLLVMSAIIGTGIWLTGYDQVHWLLYIPPVFGLFAAITGICPGFIISRYLTGDIKS